MENNVTKITAHEVQAEKTPAEDRQFYFGMTAATLLSFVLAFIAGELI